MAKPTSGPSLIVASLMSLDSPAGSAAGRRAPRSRRPGGPVPGSWLFMGEEHGARRRHRYVKVHRGRGRYEHVGTFRWDEHGGKRAARRAAESAEADAHERRRNRKSIETSDEFRGALARRLPDRQARPDTRPTKERQTLRGYRDELKPFVREFRASNSPTSTARWRGSSPTPARAPRSSCGTMLSDAVDDGLIDANPFANLQLEQARGRSQHPTITEEELHRSRRCRRRGARRRLGPGVPLVHPREPFEHDGELVHCIYRRRVEPGTVIEVDFSAGVPTLHRESRSSSRRARRSRGTSTSSRPARSVCGSTSKTAHSCATSNPARARRCRSGTSGSTPTRDCTATSRSPTTSSGPGGRGAACESMSLRTASRSDAAGATTARTSTISR